MTFDGLGSALAALGTFAGVWAVVLLFRWFQRDFASVYRSELTEIRARVDVLEAEAFASAQRERRSEMRIARLERELVTNGLPVPPLDDDA